MFARARISSWPKLIGLAAGVFGAGVTVAFAAQSALSTAFHWPATFRHSVELIASVCGVLFLLLSYPLYTARAWAYRVFVAVALLTTVAVVIFFALSAYQDSNTHMRLVFNIATAVAASTPPIFFVLVLLHSDVKQSYHADKTTTPTETSNQSPLEPTAARRDVHV